jgi:hypothetical protein
VWQQRENRSRDRSADIKQSLLLRLDIKSKQINPWDEYERRSRILLVRIKSHAKPGFS